MARAPRTPGRQEQHKAKQSVLSAIQIAGYCGRPSFLILFVYLCHSRFNEVYGGLGLHVQELRKVTCRSFKTWLIHLMRVLILRSTANDLVAALLLEM